MKNQKELKNTIETGLDIISKESDIIEAEIFASSNKIRLNRISFTTAFPSNGVEEPKSSGSFGVGILAVFEKNGKRLIGYGSEASDIRAEGIHSALNKARSNAVEDPDFYHLPDPSEIPDRWKSEKKDSELFFDPSLRGISEKDFVEAGWKTLEGAIETFERKGKKDHLIIGGDIISFHEEMAVGNTRGIHANDSTARIISSITAMCEKENTKGTGSLASLNLEGFNPDYVGRTAAQNALSAIGGRKIKGGKYKVVMSPQAVSDLIDLIAACINIDVIYAFSSPFMGKFGQKILSSKITLYDDGRRPEGPGSKCFTCEGLPTGKKLLVENGKLAGFTSNHYSYLQMLHDPKGKEKLGVDPKDIREALYPQNGFRFSEKTGRSFESSPGIMNTNLVMECSNAMSHEELLREVGNGLYIGRIWYSYPINGLRAADFTSTVVGDSYLIEGGKLGAPLLPNAVRLNDNFVKLFQRVIGSSNTLTAVVSWNTDAQFPILPEVAFEDLSVEEIAQ